MAQVALERVRKSYGAVTSLNELDLSIGDGEFFSLLGPSGCGKTTTLRIIAGFVEADSGRVLIDGRDVTALPPEKRDIGMVFQNYAIFPHMSVFDNIAFGLRLRKLPGAEIKRRVNAALEQVGLAGYSNRFQKQMSGGERQRVALARVLVTEPRILLLDEPLSALDKALREEMKYWIKSLQRDLGITTIYVTHDQGEALAMSDRIAVMNKARVLQVGTPNDIYERPASRFVAEFIGHSNIVEGTVRSSNGTSCEIEVAGARVQAPCGSPVSAGASVPIAVRPENIGLGVSPDTGPLVRFEGEIAEQYYLGPIIRYEIRYGGGMLIAELPNRLGESKYAPGTKVPVWWNINSAQLLWD